MRRLLRIQVWAILLFVSGCGTAGPGDWQDEGTHLWRDLASPGGRGTGFTQLAPDRTGIVFANGASHELLSENLLLGQGSGVTLGDADGDGMVDIYFARIDGPNVLYRNLGGLHFEDVTEIAGVGAPDRFSTGAVFVDADGDRDLDLFVTALGGPNSLFVNDGAGRFVERNREIGLASDRGSITATFADIEGDGDLDLFIGNYKTRTVDDVFPPWERVFDRVVRPAEDGGFRIATRFRDHYRVEMREDLDLLVRTERADPDWLYLNDGSGRFDQVAFNAGRFLDVEGNPIETEPDYFVLSARFFDADGDGDPDLYVAADFEDPDHFWINDGTGTFREIPPLALRTTSNSAMALDFSDVDRDGDVDLFEVDMLSKDMRRRHTQKPSHTVLPKVIGWIDDRPQMMRNTLFINRGDNTYAQISYQAGVHASDWSWSSVFLDVDLDGYEDLVLSNGHIWDVMDSDIQERLRRSVPGRDWRRLRFSYPRLELKNVAFRNNGDLTFDDMSEQWGIANEADVSHGLALGDLDDDGDLDVVVNRFDAPAAVYRNDATRGRISVRLLGAAPNTQGVGSKIRVLGGPTAEQQKEVVVGGLYVSSSDPTYTFATGDAEEVTVQVDWRTGQRTEIRGALPNRAYEIRESGAAAPNDVRTEQRQTTRADPWFSDQSHLLQHTHIEVAFDDFSRQPLLPNALSLLGPGVTWYDVDSDGDEDLLLTEGGGTPLSLYRNDSGRFNKISLDLPGLQYDQTTVLAVPSGEAGGTALLVGHSSYEAVQAREAARAAAVIRIDLDERALPVPADSAGSVAVAGGDGAVGPLAVSDYDGDGDLDLFVGYRVQPGAYPVPPSSRFLRNEEGEFAPDDENTALLESLGMVSGATFSDVDVDGDPDLLLAVEWGALTLLVNEGGRFILADGVLGVSTGVSRWNGVTTGDLNEDGVPDIVATNWGRNTAQRPSERRPLLLYHGDFDRNGVLDLIEAQLDPARDSVYPLVRFPRIRVAMPRVNRNISSHMEYADATVDYLVGSSAAEFSVLTTESYDHLLFLSEAGSYSVVPLPVEAQFAPAFYAGIADFDGDGHEDVFLSQNFFPTEVETPRYDAGRGLLLLGDGNGNLAPVDGQISGIEVYGDQRGAAFADYDQDGRVDLVVSQNGAETKLFHNRAADPGIRVRLIGPVENPHALGAVVRLVYGDRAGPAREVHGGSGYWSQNAPMQVLGVGDGVTAVRVRWPDGSESETPVNRGTGEVVIRWMRGEGD